MSKTAFYRKQHQEILAMVKKIMGFLTDGKIMSESKEIRKLLSQFIGKLKVHLTMEDDSLYPGLLKEENKELRILAKNLKKRWVV